MKHELGGVKPWNNLLTLWPLYLKDNGKGEKKAKRTKTRSLWQLKRLRGETQHPAKFSDHKYCEQRDIKFRSFQSKGCMALRVGASHGKSAPYLVQCP